MTSLASFLKLTDDETVLHEWEVLSDAGGPRLWDVIVLAILWLLLVGAQTVTRDTILPVAFDVPLLRSALGYLLSRTSFELLFLSPWPPFIVASGFVVIAVVTRPRIKGYVALTNWRFLYYEHGQGRLRRSFHRVVSANLEDIVGLHTNYRERFWGGKNLALDVHTKHKHGVRIRIGRRGGLAAVPGIGALFSRNNIGADAFEVLPVAFRKMQEYRGRLGDPSTSY